MAEIRQQDSEVERRAMDFVAVCFKEDSSPQPNMLTRMGQPQAWKVRDALQLLLTSRDLDRQHDASKTLDKFATWLTKNRRQRRPEPDLAMELFPLLCHYQPASATKLAVQATITEAEKSGNPTCYARDDYLAECAIRRETVPYLAGRAEQLERYLNSRDAKLWDSKAVVIAGIIKSPRLADLLAHKFDSDQVYPGEVPALIWAMSQGSYSRAEQSLRRRLDDLRISRGLELAIVRSLTEFGNDAFRDAIVAGAKRAMDREFDIESLRVYLAYFRRFPGSDLQPLLLQLRDYPYNSDIRESARTILGEKLLNRT